MFDADFAIFPKPSEASYTSRNKNLVWVPRKSFEAGTVEPDSISRHSIPCMFLPCTIHTDKLLLYFHANSEDIGNAEIFFCAVRDAWAVTSL